MSESDWVGILGLAGIVGTLAGAILTPVITERMRRRTTRDDRLMVERISLYAEMFTEANRVLDGARRLAREGGPADRRAVREAERSDLESRVNILGGREVVNAGASFNREAIEFIEWMSDTANEETANRFRRLERVRAVEDAHLVLRLAMRAAVGSRMSRWDKWMKLLRIRLRLD